MISVAEAKKMLSENTGLLLPKWIPVVEALGKIIAEDIFSPTDVPSFDNSAMDGYAFLLETGKEDYQIVSQIQAGDGQLRSVRKYEAARIFTGAPVPAGADTVIPQEYVHVEGGNVSFDLTKIERGSHIRRRGDQCREGDKIIEKGTLVTPGVIALLGSVGMGEVSVTGLPKVGIIVTGNELVNPGESLARGRIYNSNLPAIISYLHLLGITDIQSSVAGDDPEELRYHVARSLRDCDVLIVSGGISVGDYDFVFQILVEAGVDPLFYKIKQRPGKPMFAGTKGSKIIFGLPGNPASVISCFNQYVKPVLQSMSGYKNAFDCSARLPLTHKWEKATPFTNILKARVDAGRVTILHGQLSFNLSPFAEANAFVVLHEEDLVKQEGDIVEIYNW